MCLSERDDKVDIVKTVAILCVIAIHVTSYGWDVYPAGAIPWVANMFWGSLTRAAVPLFLMCSGALFLDPSRDLPLKKLYTRYLARVFAAMLVWAMAYKITRLISAGNFSAPGLWQAWKEVLLFNQEFHLYYIHIILFVYICLPVVRVFVFHVDKKQLEYGLAVWFLFGIVYPTVVHFWPLNLITGFPRQWAPNMTYAAIGYLVLGYYLRFIATLSRIRSLALFCSGFMIVFVGTWYSCIRIGYFFDVFLGGMTVGVALMAAGIYGACPSQGGRFTVWVSKASFCVYLVHVFFLYAFEKLGFHVGLFSPLLSAPVVTAAIFLCSCGAYAVLVKIPGVNKWLI
jgi:surface polysaccharide O-acyltransferase-like enzyme